MALMAGALVLGGCASQESVEKAQATANSAMTAAQGAQSAADAAGAAAQKAQASADAAAQKADQAEADAQANKATIAEHAAMPMHRAHRHHRGGERG